MLLAINFGGAQKGYIYIQIKSREYIQIAQITVPELPWIQASALSYIISGHSQECVKEKKTPLCLSAHPVSQQLPLTPEFPKRLLVPGP